ncbi:MAG: hypothetical protein WHT08_16600 [Bryobacteraceae bacterium]
MNGLLRPQTSDVDVVGPGELAYREKPATAEVPRGFGLEIRTEPCRIARGLHNDVDVSFPDMRGNEAKAFPVDIFPDCSEYGHALH